MQQQDLCPKSAIIMPKESNENGENKVSKVIISHFKEPLLEKQKQLRKRGNKSLMSRTDRNRVYAHPNAMR